MSMTIIGDVGVELSTSLDGSYHIWQETREALGNET